MLSGSSTDQVETSARLPLPVGAPVGERVGVGGITQTLPPSPAPGHFVPGVRSAALRSESDLSPLGRASRAASRVPSVRNKDLYCCAAPPMRMVPRTRREATCAALDSFRT